MKILIIGLNPSRKNLNPIIPFDGTQSGVVLNRWIEHLQIKYDELTFLNLCDEVESDSKNMTLKKLRKNLNKKLELIQEMSPDLIITLGMKVRSVVTTDVLPSYRFLDMPHPSPRNRILNDKVKMNNFLNMSKKFIEEVRKNVS